jgi:hypothetical protein
MKKDAFDDVICPFNYRAELAKARAALDAIVGRYVSQNPTTGYRELAQQFHMSPAALCAIAKKYSSKRKPGPRSHGTKATFRVRHRTKEEKEIETTVMVTARKGISVEEMRSRVVSYFKTDDVSESRGMRTARRVEYDYDELEILKNPHKTRQA